jgi:hypothetical protein
MIARLATSGLGYASSLMLNRWTLSCWILGCWVLAPTLSQAQIIPRVNLNTSYTDNLFQSYNQRSDWINQAYIDLDYVFDGPFNLYYNGSANQFNENGDLFSHTHQLGLSYVKQWDQRNLLQIGTDLSTRLDRPVYQYRDMVEASTYINAKFYLRPEWLARSGYSLSYLEYLNAGSYSFFEQSAFFQLSRFLSSRTTVQLRTELGLKTYAQSANTEDILLPVRAGESRNLLQWVGRFKVAQSLGDYTGLQIEYRKRANLSGRSRYTDVAFYNPDDDLFDDRYSYQGDSLGATLKHIAPLEVDLEASGQLESRRYTGRLALDLVGEPLPSGATRQDTRQTLRLAAGKDFYLNQGPAQTVRLQLEWLYRNTDSNDPYYSADARTYTAGLSFEF